MKVFANLQGLDDDDYRYPDLSLNSSEVLCCGTILMIVLEMEIFNRLRSSLRVKQRTWIYSTFTLITWPPQGSARFRFPNIRVSQSAPCDQELLLIDHVWKWNRAVDDWPETDAHFCQHHDQQNRVHSNSGEQKEHSRHTASQATLHGGAEQNPESGWIYHLVLFVTD